MKQSTRLLIMGIRSKVDTIAKNYAKSKVKPNLFHPQAFARIKKLGSARKVIAQELRQKRNFETFYKGDTRRKIIADQFAKHNRRPMLIRERRAMFARVRRLKK